MLKRRGFTLIELLVVIAIIAILAAILFPVFAQAREAARKTSCASNLKQIGLGIMQYVQDYDETYPCNWVSGLWQTQPAPGLNAKWMDLIQPYVKNDGIFNCPSDANKTRAYIYKDRLPAASDVSWGSYCTNVAYWDGNVGTPPSSDFNNQKVTLAAVTQPADTIWAGDGNGSFQTAWPNIGAQPVINQNKPRTLGLNGGTDLHEGAWVERHQEKCNVVWADGHVSSVSLDKMTEKATTGPTAGAYKRLTIEED